MTRTERLLAAIFLAGVTAYAVQSGEDFHEKDLKGKSFSGKTLNGANFEDAILRGADFTGASLKDAVFKGADIEGTFFTKADLSGTDFRGSTGSAHLSGSNMSHANFEGVSFIPTSDCICRGANFRKTKIAGYVAGGDFSGADFSGASLRGVRLNDRPESFRWKGALYDDDTAFPEGFDPKAAGMVLKGDKTDDKNAENGGKKSGTPPDRDFHEKDLKNKDFRHCVLNNADFTDAILNGADFSEGSLKNAKFNSANLERANFTSADLQGADFRGATGSARFVSANLTRANFEGTSFFPSSECKCRGANFKKAKWEGSLFGGDFTEADFRGASLRGVRMSDRQESFRWKRAVYDDDTAFPEGFDPKAVGMVMAKTDDSRDEKK